MVLHMGVGGGFLYSMGLLENQVLHQIINIVNESNLSNEGSGQKRDYEKMLGSWFCKIFFNVSIDSSNVEYQSKMTKP